MPATHDVRVAASETAPQAETYVYVARRAHGIVGLAEARHLTDADARAIVDRIADDLERCTTSLEATQLLVEGAARIVIVAGPDGVPLLNVKLAPGDAVAQNALLCLAAPVRATPLPPPTASATPGLAIEATWGPARPHRPLAADDAATP